MGVGRGVSLSTGFVPFPRTFIEFLFLEIALLGAFWGILKVYIPVFACHFRTRKDDLLWLEDDLRERKWISYHYSSANEVRVGPQFGQDGQSTLGYSMTCVVIKILVAPKGEGAAARSANACIRHCLTSNVYINVCWNTTTFSRLRC